MSIWDLEREFRREQQERDPNYDARRAEAIGKIMRGAEAIYDDPFRRQRAIQRRIREAGLSELPAGAEPIGETTIEPLRDEAPTPPAPRRLTGPLPIPGAGLWKQTD